MLKVKVSRPISLGLGFGAKELKAGEHILTAQDIDHPDYKDYVSSGIITEVSDKPEEPSTLDYSKSGRPIFIPESGVMQIPKPEVGLNYQTKQEVDSEVVPELKVEVAAEDKGEVAEDEVDVTKDEAEEEIEVEEVKPKKKVKRAKK